MFVQSKVTVFAKHKDGLPLTQRRGGKETLVQWSNGDQQWCVTSDLEYMGSSITLIGTPEYDG